MLPRITLLDLPALAAGMAVFALGAPPRRTTARTNCSSAEGQFTPLKRSSAQVTGDWQQLRTPGIEHLGRWAWARRW
jgi:hypothetical protein